MHNSFSIWEPPDPKSCLPLQGMLLHVLSAVGVSSAAVLTYALLLVVHPTHFLQAQYTIPVLVSAVVRATACLISAICLLAGSQAHTAQPQALQA